MKISITINKEYTTYEERTIELSGAGTFEDPCIILPEMHFPNAFEIYDSHIHIEIVDLNQYSLGFIHCSNIIIKNCTLERLELTRDSKISVKDVNCKDLELNESRECFIEKCNLESLGLFKSYSNQFKNNKIQGIMNLYDTSKNNSFENNDISKDDQKVIESAQIPQEKIRKTIMVQSGKYLARMLADFEFLCTGSGTEIDPYIIGPQDHKFHDVCVSQYRSYMQFEKLIDNPKFLDFIYCKHTKVKDCEFKGLHLAYCDDFHVNNITASYIRINRTCGDVLIQNSTFGEIKLFRFNHGNITFKNCKIDIVRKNQLNLFHFQNCVDKKDNIISDKI